MHFAKLFAAIAATIAISSTASAMLVPETLIGFGSASSPGNGSMFSDPSGVVAPAGVGVNGATVTSSNTNGRALAGLGNDFATNYADISTVTDNQGVSILGWTAYRAEYISGNNAMGFLEDATSRLNVGGPNNGSAFANSSRWALVSDVITSPGLAGDTLDLSFLAGYDSGTDFDLIPYIYLDGVANSLGTLDIMGLPADANDRGEVSLVSAVDYTTIQVAFAVEAAGGTRGLLDNIQLTRTVAVPEPGVIAVGMLSLGCFGLVGRRQKQN